MAPQSTPTTVVGPEPFIYWFFVTRMLDQQNLLQVEQLIQDYEVTDVSLDVTAGVADNESIFNKAISDHIDQNQNYQACVYLQV